MSDRQLDDATRVDVATVMPMIVGGWMMTLMGRYLEDTFAAGY